jgi:hypothetical protein
VSATGAAGRAVSIVGGESSAGVGASVSTQCENEFLVNFFSYFANLVCKSGRNLWEFDAFGFFFFCF